MDENPYRTPQTPAEPIGVDAAYAGVCIWILAPTYDRPIKFALAQQLIFGVLAALTLDGGVLAKRTAVSTAAYWLCFLIIALRRPRKPTTVDRALVKWGFAFLAILTVCVR